MHQESKHALRKEYTARINRVIDHIEKRLDQPLPLEELARKAHFSPFHFHRIFRAMVGETLHHFIQRIRVEKAAAQLLRNRSKSVTAVALDCGFSGSAAFARVFKEAYGMSATQWRRRHADEQSKIRKTLRKNGKDNPDPSAYISQRLSTHINAMKWRVQMKDKKAINVEVKEMPDLHVAYVRNIGPYKGDGALFDRLFSRLMTWAGPRGVLCTPGQMVLAVYHDDPEVTEADKLRLSACITVPPETEVSGDVGKMTVPGGTFAVAHFELAGSEEYETAWDAVMGGWLPESGYQPDDRLCYEVYHNNPKEHPEGKHIVDICVPVKPL